MTIIPPDSDSKKVAVFVSSGLGNALLLTPLIKKLKQNGAQVDGVFTSHFNCEELYSATTLFDKIILAKHWTEKVILLLRRMNYYDCSYHDYFASTTMNILFALGIAKRLVVNHLPKRGFKSLNSCINYVTPVKGIHCATQNLRLLNKENSDNLLGEQDFHLPLSEKNPVWEEVEKWFTALCLTSPVIAIQIGSANNKVQYKNWPADSWREFLIRATRQHPEINFVLMGDQNETDIASQIMSGQSGKIISFVGKTTIAQAMCIIRHSILFTGVDSGLMHVAVALGKPTFTIWGASDYIMYGYQKINSEKHRLLYHSIPCHPCNSWLNPNTSRVKKPEDCPDYACIRNIQPSEVAEQLDDFMKNVQV